MFFEQRMHRTTACFSTAVAQTTCLHLLEFLEFLRITSFVRMQLQGHLLVDGIDVLEIFFEGKKKMSDMGAVK